MRKINFAISDGIDKKFREEVFKRKGNEERQLNRSTRRSNHVVDKEFLTLLSLTVT